MRLLLGSAAMSAMLCFTPGDVCDAGLVVHYRFDDPANLGKDSSGHNIQAANLGASYSPSGYSGGAASFDGATDLLRVPVDLNPAAKPRMTWGAWVKPTHLSGIRAVLSADNGGFDRDLTIDSRGGGGGWTWSTFAGNKGVLSSGVAPNPAEWTFIAGVYDQIAATVRLHVDDVTVSTSATFGPSWNFFEIGHNPSFNEFFGGLIDEVFLFDEALSPERVDDIRKRGVAGVPEPSTILAAVLGGLVAVPAVRRRRGRTARSVG